ncbi:MAG: hypothetical protein RQ760_20745 [Sedimentisphaerales bacterium]|nr:hypothetical protein [Sedimentisphaerales bacterium]
MCNQPDFLPPMINLDGAYEEIIEKLYTVFRKDFIENKARHLGRNVAINGVINEFSQGKVEGFWHVITRDDGNKTNRLIDYPRAKRLPWSKPLMENPYHDEIKFFFYDEGVSRKGIRHYICLENENYLVILKKRKYDYYWITSFYVDGYRRGYFQKKFQNRIGP